MNDQELKISCTGLGARRDWSVTDFRIGNHGRGGRTGREVATRNSRLEVCAHGPSSKFPSFTRMSSHVDFYEPRCRAIGYEC